MAEHGRGTIINIRSSEKAKSSRGGRGTSSLIRRHGLIMLAKKIAEEFRSSAIRVNAIAPGYYSGNIAGKSGGKRPKATERRLTEHWSLVRRAAVGIALGKSEISSGEVVEIEGRVWC